MPTKVRYSVVGVTTLAAVMLYLDRICIAEIARLDEFREGLNLSGGQTGMIMSAFFFSYALAQVPAGALADRFGARRMMTLYIVLWSICTAATGLATGFLSLMVARLGFGIAQAGCYPTSGGLIKRWMPLTARGSASGVVSFGGRVGGAIAPVLTALLLKDFLGWRAVLVLYGFSGLLVALLFWRTFRETPAEHPRCNDAERELIRADAPDPDLEKHRPFPIKALILSRSMWLMCILQWGVNIGWVFLVTWLPTYLKEVKGVEPRTGGMMSTLVLFAGMIGMLAGGPLTDKLTRRYGLRWGRALPLIGTKVFAVIAYLVCLWIESPWAIVAALAMVAFMTDMGVPAVWAYMLDVGGKHASAVFGWANMWGNFGAAMTPALIPWVLKTWDSNGDWHEAFLLCAAGFVIAGVAALGIKADKPIQ